MQPEVVFTKAAPKTGFSEGTESPIAQGVKCGVFNRVVKEYFKGVQAT